MLPPVIIMGCPRSGTTFLSNFLEAVPEVESIIGTLLPVAVPQVAANLQDRRMSRALAMGFERAIDAYLHSGRYISRGAALQKWFKAPTGLGGLRKAMRRERQEQVVVFKEPMLAYAPQFVLDAFPQGRVVHIYRDGRDCANSLVDSYDELSDAQLRSPRNINQHIGRKVDDRTIPWWVAPGDEQAFLEVCQFARCAWMWKFMVGGCMDCFERSDLGPDRLLEIRYESFMASPGEEGKRLLDFIGVPMSAGANKVLSTARTSSFGKYARRRSPAEIEEAERVARRELVAYGYLDAVETAEAHV